MPKAKQPLTRKDIILRNAAAINKRRQAEERTERRKVPRSSSRLTSTPKCTRRKLCFSSDFNEALEITEAEVQVGKDCEHVEVTEDSENNEGDCILCELCGMCSDGCSCTTAEIDSDLLKCNNTYCEKRPTWWPADDEVVSDMKNLTNADKQTYDEENGDCNDALEIIEAEVQVGEECEQVEATEDVVLCRSSENSDEGDCMLCELCGMCSDGCSCTTAEIDSDLLKCDHTYCEKRPTWWPADDEVVSDMENLTNADKETDDCSYDDEENDKDYVPEVCGCHNCAEDIFLACYSCNAFLCYDHMDTACTEHNQNSLYVDSSDSTDDDAAAPVDKQKPIKRRSRYPRKTVTRQRRKNPETWMKNIRKRARLTGQEYLSTTGKVVPAKKVQPCVCNHGRQKVFKCEMFSEEKRLIIFSAYYSSGDYARQRDFLLHNIQSTATSGGQRKHQSLQFTLPLDGSRKERVCKKMFLRTLNVTDRLVNYTLQKSTDEHLSQHSTAGFSYEDRRGRHKPHNRTPEELLDRVRQHINSFPTMAPHYCRADTNRRFLGCELNISKMYHLFVEKCKADGEQWVKEGVYRNVFCSEFNLSFHHPRKDACAKCSQFENATEEEKMQLKEQYDQHIERKDRAQAEKAADKEKAKESSEWHAVTADLQSVLSTPSGNVSSLYYARKLSVYNFTVYNQHTGDGNCMVWDETQGQRGANEIASLLYIYLKENLDINVKHVVITSDSTVAQNRNQYVTCMMLFAVSTLPVETIEQKFLEPGHTHMEVDSMHAAIDCSRKNIKIFAPCQWTGVLQMARSSHPYSVREVERHEFYDSHTLAKSLNTVLAKSVQWMKVKCIRVSKDSLDSIEIKEDYGEDYRKIPLWKCRAVSSQRTTRRRRSDDSASLACTIPKMIGCCTLTSAYPQPLPVSEAKKRDLLKLCKSGAITSRYHDFYTALRTSGSVEDCLPQPDSSEMLDE